MLAGALEHQMFEEMREPGFAWRLVGRADLVPDHLRDDGRAVIGDHHHLQAVVERESGGTFRRHRGLGQGATGGERAVESNAAKSETAKRRLDIMTFAGASHRNAANGLREQFAQCEQYGPNRSGSGNRASVHGASAGIRSRRRETSLTIRHTCPGDRIVFLVQRFLRPGAVSEIRRRRLVAGRRLGQRVPGRLALERRRLGLAAAEQAAEAAAIAELRRAQDRRCRRMDRRAGRPSRRPEDLVPFAASSLGIRTRPASRGSLLAFLRACDRALRRAIVGSFGQFGAFTSAVVPARRRQVELGGTTSGERSR